MDIALVVSVYITGILSGFFLLAGIVFLCIKKQDGTLMRESAGEFLEELGITMQKQPTSHDVTASKITNIS